MCIELYSYKIYEIKILDVRIRDKFRFIVDCNIFFLVNDGLSR